MTDSPKTDKLGTLSVSVRWAAQNVLTDLENEVGSNCWPETTAKAIVELEEYLSCTNTPDTLLPLDELAWLFNNNKEYSSDSTIESIQKLFNALHVSRRARKSRLAREVSYEPNQSLAELLVSVNAMLATPPSDGGKWKVAGPLSLFDLFMIIARMEDISGKRSEAGAFGDFLKHIGAPYPSA